MANIALSDAEGAAQLELLTVIRRDEQFHKNVNGGQLHPRVIDALKRLDRMDTGAYIDWPFIARNFKSARGDVLRINEGYRTPEAQAVTYAQGRTMAGAIVTKAKPYESYHQWGLAFDLVLCKYGYDKVTIAGVVYDFGKPDGWLKLGIPQYFESCGLTWGGRWSDFVDTPHYEHRTGVPVDNAFCGAPWWSLDARVASLGSRGGASGNGQGWIVAAVAAAGVWMLKKRG